MPISVLLGSPPLHLLDSKLSSAQEQITGTSAQIISSAPIKCAHSAISIGRAQTCAKQSIWHGSRPRGPRVGYERIDIQDRFKFRIVNANALSLRPTQPLCSRVAWT